MSKGSSERYVEAWAKGRRAAELEAELSAARAEVEKLREALDKIAFMPANYPAPLREIARAALATPEEGNA